MKILPLNVTAYKQTPVFTENTIPAGMLHHHTTKKDSWGKICVQSGQLRYHILTDPSEEHVITPDNPGIIEPQTPHKVESMGSVEFFVEFYH
ncbi:protein of unknown function DUF1971 [Thalassoporum mexicanum PCC 7367]|uniref:DUF1971 domain-containing protein n=1 Tax=Thalassoporum mexicanum TaxID=3457544 RepID=UPI00029F8895|nr:DUF1971 domain-containing protein [Pseudanabaena sp. PCC 7367]AFY70542.1 protein of unknown function DUF1971 [Pseudanabaena sp. PCC 7367]